VLDGHGEAGDGVSGYYKDRYINEVFEHPDWARRGVPRLWLRFLD
jgi:hypothetical protein